MPENDQSDCCPEHNPSPGDDLPTPAGWLSLIRDCLKRYARSPHERPKWTDIAIVILTLFIAVAAIGSAWIFEGQLQEMHQGTIASQRPWIGIRGDMTIDDGPTFTLTAETPPIEIRMKTAYTLENFGASPAVKVFASPIPMVTTKRLPAKTLKDVMCSTTYAATTNPDFPTSVIMPKTTLAQKADSFSAVVPEITDVKVIWLLMCISYQDTLDSRVHHTTVLLGSVPQPGAMPREAIKQPKLTYVPPAKFIVVDADAD